MKREYANRAFHADLRRLVLLVIGALGCPAAVLGQGEPNTEAAALRRQADALRASADRLFKLQRIPWITDPAEGFRLAQEENRPVFLYVQAGDPLEDC